MPQAALQIPLEDLQRSTWLPLYVGDRARYATATSVRLLDARTLVCCSLLAREIYLIRFDLETGTFEVLDRTATTYAGSDTETDLCDVDGHGRIVTSNCKAASMSLYRLVNDRILFERDLPTGLPNYCHGARFLGADVVVATMINDPIGAYFFDLQTMQRLLYIETSRLLKDICFLPNGRALLIATSSQPLTETTSRGVETETSLVEFDLGAGSYRLLKQQVHGHGQFDSAVVHAGRAFVADSYRDRILVLDVDTLQQVDQLEGYAFPHGVDVNYGLVAVACYGNNSIHVSRLAP